MQVPTTAGRYSRTPTVRWRSGRGIFLKIFNFVVYFCNFDFFLNIKMKKAPWPPATHRQLARPARIRPVGLGPAPPPIGEQHKASTGPQLATLLHFLTHVNMQGWPPLLFSFSRMGQGKRRRREPMHAHMHEACLFLARPIAN